MEASPFPYELRALEQAEREALLKDRALVMFIGSVSKFPSNRPLMDGLEQFRTDLLNAPHPAVDIEKLTFRSALTTRWEANNTVHAYYYRPVAFAGPRPAVVIPSYIFMDGMSRPLSLLFAQRGFRVLEVNLPLLADRSPTEAGDGGLGDRFAALRFGPAEFSQTFRHAVSDVAQTAEWVRAQPGTDAAHIAVCGNSQRGNFAIHAYRTTTAITHAVSLSPLTNARRIWEEKMWESYRTFLESRHFTAATFLEQVIDEAVLRPDLPARDPKNLLIVYMPEDNASTTAEIRLLAARLGDPPLFEIDASHIPKHVHEVGMIPGLAALFERIVCLVGQPARVG